MKQSIGSITFLVNDYDEAINYFTNKLNFVLVEDNVMSPEKRWVRVVPRGSSPNECSLLLAKASTPLQLNTVGKQSGERVCFFLYTDDFMPAYSEMKKNGVDFQEEPRHESYGSVVVVFKDLYGNKWDFISL